MSNKEFDCSKDEIWDAKYNTVRNYLVELEKLKIINPLYYSITKFVQIRVVNSDKNNENSKASKEYKVNLICKNYGEIFDARDRINKFYITNFEMDNDCFQKIINNYEI